MSSMVQNGTQRRMSSDERRAEILGKKADGPKYAIEGGEQLMSATDRYRELSKLVDDMELVYFNSLGN